MDKSLNVIDLFCGCGGLSLGFEQAGFNVLLGIDMWKDALKTFEFNHHNSNTLCADLASLDPIEVAKKISDKTVHVIIGGPPCQGFSVAGKRIIDDERNKLYKSFVRMVEYFKPQAFVLENVPNILSIGNGIIKDAIIKDFTILGYNVVTKVLTASDYGVPQNRRRAIFVGLKNDIFNFDLPKVEYKVTTKDALSDLPENTLEDGSAYPIVPQSTYQTLMRKNSTAIYNHEITEHDEKTKRIISMVPDGGNYRDLPAEFQNIRKVHIAWTRLCSSKPSITIDTGHRHHFHYKYNRIPTARESARIQSFPDEFIFKCSKTSQLKQIGNAVPPLLAQALAVQLMKQLNNNKNSNTMTNSNSEVTKTNTSFYQIEGKNWERIHFARPRFKSNMESVLLYMASECCRLPQQPCDDYKNAYFDAIKLYPDNIGKKGKTLDNWRTEIPALFGFYNEDKANNVTRTSRMAHFLDQNQDLTQFLKQFLLTFQLPGGHIKAEYACELITLGVRFKPAKFILTVLIAGNEILAEQGKPEKKMCLNSEEVTYCIFNDLRVLRGIRTAREIAETILENRKKKLAYYNKNDEKIFNTKGKARTKGDVTRYALDMLDYMEHANLLNVSHNYYSMNEIEINTIETFVNDNSYFDSYDIYYNQSDIKVSDIAKLEPEWFKYVNDSLNEKLFKTDIVTLLSTNKIEYSTFSKKINDLLACNEISTGDSGNLGEAIIVGHEKLRLSSTGYEDLANTVKIVDSPGHRPGYDINSREGVEDGYIGKPELQRFVEVKTTISRKPIKLFSFHMTEHEWNTAATVPEHYCIYRLVITPHSKTLYVLRNPERLYKEDRIRVTLHNGAEISFNTKDFKTTELFLWQD